MNALSGLQECAESPRRPDKRSASGNVAFTHSLMDDYH
ncbi:hypothetical protein ECTW07793_3738 [Escherichia coli TW07793]|nr:hypothetical protein ECTW07793_3738 [Escherichia coli TW07793]